MELIYAIWDFLNIPLMKLMILIGCVRLSVTALIRNRR